MMMASDDKKTKAAPAAKSETAAPKSETAAKTETAPSAETAKPAGGEAAAAPANYSRGEGQKPVSAAYKENWNVIFGKKSGKKKKR
jgi:hypothetical protein